MIPIALGTVVAVDGVAYCVMVLHSLHNYKGRSLTLEAQRQNVLPASVAVRIGDTIVFNNEELVVDSISVDADADNAKAEIHATDPFIAQVNLDIWRIELGSLKTQQQVGELLPVIKKHLDEDHHC